MLFRAGAEPQRKGLPDFFRVSKSEELKAAKGNGGAVDKTMIGGSLSGDGFLKFIGDFGIENVTILLLSLGHVL